MKNNVSKGGDNFIFAPIHQNGKSPIQSAIMQVVDMARGDGVVVDDSVGNKFAPTAYGWRDGGKDFVDWLASKRLELCKSDRSGSWWTVVRTADVLKRDKRGTAISAINKFVFAMV